MKIKEARLKNRERASLGGGRYVLAIKKTSG